VLKSAPLPPIDRRETRKPARGKPLASHCDDETAGAARAIAQRHHAETKLYALTHTEFTWFGTVKQNHFELNPAFRCTLV
jgi:hypothetical protein